MDNSYFIIGLSHISTGVILLLLTLPLIKNKIAPNQLYGIRTKKSLASAENWKKINHYGGKQFLFWSLALIILSIIGLFIKWPNHQSIFFLYLFLPVFMIIPPIVNILRFQKKL